MRMALQSLGFAFAVLCVWFGGVDLDDGDTIVGGPLVVAGFVIGILCVSFS